MSDKKAAKAKKVLARHARHYTTDMGTMPPSLGQFAHFDPDAFDGYSQMRTALLKSEKDGAKLPLKYKHLILAVLDATRDEKIGIINHTRAAMMAGLTVEEVAEGLLLGIIVYGAPAWGKTGRKAAEFAVEFQKELDAKKKQTKPGKKRR